MVSFTSIFNPFAPRIVCTLSREHVVDDQGTSVLRSSLASNARPGLVVVEEPSWTRCGRPGNFRPEIVTHQERRDRAGYRRGALVNTLSTTGKASYCHGRWQRPKGTPHEHLSVLRKLLCLFENTLTSVRVPRRNTSARQNEKIPSRLRWRGGLRGY